MPFLLDGPMGTELQARGVHLPSPAWTAWAVENCPDHVAQIHRAYAAAGAVLHTAATFRTTARVLGDRWTDVLSDAVNLARESVPRDHQVLGSLAPLNDCYRPDLSPRNAEPEHRLTAEALAMEGVDILLCETFPHLGEAEAAARAAASTGLPVWVSLTAGPDATLLTPSQVEEGVPRLVAAGAQVVLVNCIGLAQIGPYVEALARAAIKEGVAFGVYANAGKHDEGLGWGSPSGPLRHVESVAEWLAAGAEVVGGCCGTGPAHIAAMASLFGPGS